LSQVYGIVAQHEGHIDVNTAVGQGTTFTLYLPAMPVHQSKTPAQETQNVVQGRGETILIVEDDETLRKALVEHLQLLNYRVLEAANGQAALAMIESQQAPIALVLSDLVMPEMGGQALFHALRQRGLEMPMLMLSGHPMQNELEKLQAQGLAGWMLKPPDMGKLSHLLAQALGAEPE
jgi:CheY-like chemotaxis protein